MPEGYQIPSNLLEFLWCQYCSNQECKLSTKVSIEVSSSLSLNFPVTSSVLSRYALCVMHYSTTKTAVRMTICFGQYSFSPLPVAFPLRVVALSRRKHKMTFSGPKNQLGRKAYCCRLPLVELQGMKRPRVLLHKRRQLHCLEMHSKTVDEINR